MVNEHHTGADSKELTLNDLAGMIDVLAQSTAKGFEVLGARVDTVVEMVGTLQGQVSSIETDIKTIKGDVKDVDTRIDDVEKEARTDLNRRLRPIEQKLGMPSPK
jgi:prophage DNA circulation protein